MSNGGTAQEPRTLARACAACGAEAGLFLCTYCGTPTRALTNEADERSALDELHAELARIIGAGDATVERRHRLLTNAFLPSSPSVLVEAGLRMVPVLEQAVGRADAAGRMRAICIKLRLASAEPTCRAAEAEYREALARYERYDASVGRQVAIVIGAVVLAVIVAVVLALR